MNITKLAKIQKTKMQQSAEGGKFKFNCIITIMIFFALYFISSIPQSLITSIVVVFSIISSGDTLTPENIVNSLSSPTSSTLISMLVTTVFTTILCIVYCRCIEKRKIESMGITKRNIFFEYGIGIIIGAVMFSLAVFICVISGALTLKLNSQISLGIILLFLLGYFFQGMSEEFLCRGFFMMSLSRRYPIAFAVFINSLIFAVLHLSNNSIGFLAFTNLLLFGLFASLYVIKRGSITGACAIHTIWNFAQGNFYGISVSGMNVTESVLISTSETKYAFVNGGGFGLEGGIAVTIVLIISIVIICIIPTKVSEIANEGVQEKSNVDNEHASLS